MAPSPAKKPQTRAKIAIKKVEELAVELRKDYHKFVDVGEFIGACANSFSLTQKAVADSISVAATKSNKVILARVTFTARHPYTKRSVVQVEVLSAVPQQVDEDQQICLFTRDEIPLRFKAKMRTPLRQYDAARKVAAMK